MFCVSEHNNKKKRSKVISITNQQLTYPVASILPTTRNPYETMALLAGKSGKSIKNILKFDSLIDKN